MRFPSLVVLCLAVLLSSCGQDNGGRKTNNGENPPPPVTGTTRRLVVFGAGFCSSCKVQFPELQRLLSGLPAKTRQALSFKLVVTAGDPGSVRPTQEIADNYKAALHLDATAKPDVWRWQTFKDMVSKTDLRVPAAVIYEGTNKVKVFTAGDTTFVPAEIVAAAVTGLPQ